jgi:response regulator RpfG family c-di-GMP phosphodiesterase
MRITQRRLLVLLLVFCQMACMAFGLVWASRWLRREFEQSTLRNVIAVERSLVSDFARRAADLPIECIEPGARGWNKLQNLCEQSKSLLDGLTAVIRSDNGALACHSRLKREPQLLSEVPGRLMLATDRGVAPLIDAVAEADLADKLSLTGRVEIDGVPYVVTCLSLPRLGAVVAVFESQAAIDARVANLLDPLTRAGVITAVAVVAVTALLTMLLVMRFENTLSTVSGSVEKEVERRTKELLNSRNAVVYGMAKLAESRSKDSAQHLERLRAYVTILASEMAKQDGDIDRHFVGNLAVASALHDLGKVSVPDGVLLKRGLLTPAERRAMQLHTVLGGESVAAMQRLIGEHDEFLELGRQVALAHHERWDGSGYPHGLQGKSIPMAARIVALADVYDALTSNRSYRDALSHAEAREWIVSQYGSHFDPAVVEAFVAREKDFIRLSRVQQLADPSDLAAQTNDLENVAAVAAVPETPADISAS